MHERPASPRARSCPLRRIRGELSRVAARATGTLSTRAKGSIGPEPPLSGRIEAGLPEASTPTSVTNATLLFYPITPAAHRVSTFSHQPSGPYSQPTLLSMRDANDNKPRIPPSPSIGAGGSVREGRLPSPARRMDSDIRP